MQIRLSNVGAILFLTLCVFPCVRRASAQADSQTAVPPASSPVRGTIRGQILDPTHALIRGANVTLLTAEGQQLAASTSDASGEFLFRGLKAGDYLIRVTSEGFGPFQSGLLQLAAHQAKRLDITMAVLGNVVSVTVAGEDSPVTTEAGANASAVVLKGDDLDALAEDPDELANELSALAGPSAGPNGSETFIDGFSGGELPPESAILQIRVNQNPFSAEFDRLGYGRLEILTKPGTEKLHGQALLQGNDNSFNTGDPFTANIPAYHSYQFSGSLTGAISKSASFSLNVDSRDLQSVNAWVIPDAVLPNSAGVYVDNVNYPVSLLSPHILDNVSLRFDWQLGKTTMTARYGFWYQNEKGNLDSGPGTLASGSTHESNSDHTAQLSSTTVFNDHFVNESQLQFERHDENHYPDSTQCTTSVAGDFVGGGFTGQIRQDHRIALEFQNLSTLSYNRHAISFGTRLRDNRDANKSTANFNGTFNFSPTTMGQTTYSASQVYEHLANGLASGQTFNALVAQGFGPSSASYTVGNPSAVANVFDAALFFQDDIRLSNRLSLSGGLRWEAQNHIADHNDWAPRVAVAYALDGRNGQKVKTVLRAGYGIFYDRVATANFYTINRSNRVRQVVFSDPKCSASASSLDNIDMTACTSGTGTTANSTPSVRYEIAPDYHASYTGQTSLSVERQLLPGTSVTVTYLHSFGVHQQVLRNANQAIGGTPQTTSQSYLYQYFPEAIFKQHQFITSFKTRVGKNLSLSGFYTYSTAVSNGAGGIGNNAVSNAYDLNQDLGRAGFVRRNVAFLTGTYNGPWGMTFNPFVISQSGQPFNITLAADPLNNLFNQRPTYATASTPAIDKVATPFGVLDSAALPGEQRVPVNLGTGPASFAVNLSIGRAFSFGGRLNGNGNAPTASSSSAEVGRKYALRFSVQALNVFNNINYGTPIGVLGSPYFDRPTSLAGDAYSTGSAARRIYLQMAFSF
ncbi:MAG TPA: carboxypeptidase regulatory-like domain-containing protein [Acidobacteriaceae bacterium]